MGRKYVVLLSAKGADFQKTQDELLLKILDFIRKSPKTVVSPVSIAVGDSDRGNYFYMVATLTGIAPWWNWYVRGYLIGYWWHGHIHFWQRHEFDKPIIPPN